ncbi:putative bifunctional diguanylate cyclase/phosphodiesterase [Ferribacterium limneticum]|uniref:putative bifunctional diguanylate cyclase/phosphodiesterase n=1 Tax=Ferribacterium limneticum TaxID=76259 RepID=UPI001CFB0BA4|nr:EAL domain-containing protein [Ferribacterium limneticum]UCV20650.1 EAL domain-containing protein [Ferribacterium limneticum]
MNAITALYELARVPGIVSRQNILIVDDEPHFRHAYKELLAGEQRSIDEASTGQEAIAKLREGKTDLVILDLRLPDISGFEIMEWMTSHHINASVIVFSADKSINSAIHALRHRAFEFLRKDCDPNDMILAVDRALANRLRDQELAVVSAQLQHSEQLHRFLVEQSPDLIFTLDRLGRFTFINGRVSTLLGYSPDELVGQNYTRIVDPRDHEHVQYAFNERRVGERATSNLEVRFKRKPSMPRAAGGPVMTAILSSQGVYESTPALSSEAFLGTSGVARDISERKKAEETITFQAFHDLLTKLPNRILFVDRLEMAIAQASRRKEKLAVMFLDIDRFKLVNDSYGHQIGDELLRKFAARVRSCLRTGDTLARQGGDEFTALLPNISNNEDAHVVAEKILSELRKPFVLGETQFLATTSIGIAVYPDNSTSAEDLIRCADMAMYKVKDQGKNGALAFQPDMHTAHLDRLSLENDLRKAVKEGDQFELHFQPQIDAALGKIVGVEALIRWHHPSAGMISPDLFIPIAEETGLIITISDWVLREACAQLAHLKQQGFGDLRLGVNLSAREFDRIDLLERIRLPLDEFRIAPESLEIEITESLLMKDAENIVARVKHLRSTGVHISIDDFGTRYSSLNYLRRFSVSRIKIDQSFVRDLRTSHDSFAIIQAIVGIAKNFNLHVIVEGVETEQQVAILRQLGCNEMQGYFFSRPLPSRQLIEFLQDSQDQQPFQAAPRSTGNFAQI